MLKQHTSEPIYSRTDHHWAPLGAYYAAGEFARAARVDFKPLSAYEKKTVRGYVGSMYTFSKDMAVKKAPEDFIYYEPQGIDYKVLINRIPNTIIMNILIMAYIIYAIRMLIFNN